MKIRFTLFVLAIAAWTWFNSYLVQPAYVVAKNTAAVATVNGGDSAFVAQQAVARNFNYGLEFLGIGFLLIVFWIGPINKALSTRSVSELS